MGVFESKNRGGITYRVWKKGCKGSLHRQCDICSTTTRPSVEPDTQGDTGEELDPFLYGPHRELKLTSDLGWYLLDTTGGGFLSSLEKLFY